MDFIKFFKICGMKLKHFDFRQHAYKVSFVFLWISAFLFAKEAWIYAIAALISCIAILVWRADN